MIALRPLPSSFMVASMLGLAIFGVYTFSGRIDPTWGFTFLLIFGIMFVAAIFSMTPVYEDFKENAQKVKKSAPKPKKTKK